MRSSIIKVFAFLLLPFLAVAQDVSVSNFYARPTKGNNGAAFMTITNHTEGYIKLTGASTDVSDHMEIHTHIKEGDIYRMRSIPYIVINPGATVVLEPGGLHLMLMNLKNPLEEGTTISIALDFAGKEHETFVVPVKKKSCECCKKK
jgi:copper(I)-binding protein